MTTTGRQRISGGTVLRRGSNHVETVLDDEVVMMSIEQGSYFALGGTAQDLWGLLDQPRTLDGLVASLTEKYQVDRDDCERDVLGFLTDLLESGLIEVET